MRITYERIDTQFWHAQKRNVHDVYTNIFIYTKKRARKFSFFPGLSTHLLGKGSSRNVTSNIERL